MKLLLQGNAMSLKRRLLFKMLLAMKLTAILLLTAALQMSVTGHAQKVSVFMKNAPLEQALETLHKHTGFSFIFISQMIS